MTRETSAILPWRMTGCFSSFGSVEFHNLPPTLIIPRLSRNGSKVWTRLLLSMQFPCWRSWILGVKSRRWENLTSTLNPWSSSAGVSRSIIGVEMYFLFCRWSASRRARTMARTSAESVEKLSMGCSVTRGLTFVAKQLTFLFLIGWTGWLLWKESHRPSFSVNHDGPSHHRRDSASTGRDTTECLLRARGCGQRNRRLSCFRMIQLNATSGGRFPNRTTRDSWSEKLLKPKLRTW